MKVKNSVLQGEKGEHAANSIFLALPVIRRIQARAIA